MGNAKSIIDEKQSFNLSIDIPKYIYVKSTNIKYSNNIKYVYFSIKGVKPSELIQREAIIYISSLDIEDNMFEDKVKTIIPKEFIVNNIDNKKWNDIYLYSDKSNKLIIRYDNLNSSNITLIYVID